MLFAAQSRDFRFLRHVRTILARNVRTVPACSILDACLADLEHQGQPRRGTLDDPNLQEAGPTW